MKLIWNYILSIFENVDRYFTGPEKKTPTTKIILFGILILTGFLIFSRTANLFFELDDFKFLWWSITRIHEPWKAFTDPSLFANYYRPVISLVWWFHSLCFGINAYYHQMALGVWWLLVVGLVFYWNTNEQDELSGFIAGIILLASLAVQDLIVWKSWLTTCCSVVFHLLTLICLQKHLQQPHKRKLWGMLFFFVLAALSKESARLILLFTCSAVILTFPGKSRKEKQPLLFIIFPLWCFFLLTSNTLRSLLIHKAGAVFHFAASIPDLSYFAYTIIDNNWLELITYIAITISLSKDNPRFLWRPVLCNLFSLAGYLWATSFGVDRERALSFALIIYTHGLWLSPNLRFIAMPLAWLTFSFWPLVSLNSVPSQFIGYAADASVALAILAGCIITEMLQNTIKLLRSRNCIYRFSLYFMLLLIALQSLIPSMQNVDRKVSYMEYTYSAPIQTLLPKITQDLTGIRSWG